MVEGIRKIVNNALIRKSLVVFLLRSLGVLFLFGVTLFLTNNFEAELVGQYDISRSVLIIVGTVCLMGFNQSIIYYSGYLKSKAALSSINLLYLKMLRIILLSAVVLFGIYYLIPESAVNALFEKNVYVIVLKTLGVLVFYALTILNIEMYRAINKIEVAEVLRNVIRHLFFFIAIIALDAMSQHAYLIDVFLLNFVFLAILTTIAIFVSLRKLPLEENKEHLSFKTIIKRSYPMSISLMSFLLMQNTDIILLGKFGSFTDVAHYAVAVKLTMIIALVLSSVNAVYAPKFSELFNKGLFVQLREDIKKSTRLIFALTAPVILAMLVFSETVLSFFGPGYNNAALALKILLAAQIINAMSGSVGIYMNMSGNERVFQRILIISLILNVVLNLILIPKYGLMGAAVATSISTVIWNLYSVIFLYRKKQIKTFLH